MRRPHPVVASRSPRKPVARSGPRNVALAVSVVVASRRGPTVPVTSRVRDSLVLRVVVKKLPAHAGPTANHERRAC